MLTPNYVSSAWAEFENLMLATLDPAIQKLQLIPLLKESCDLPLRTHYLTFVDFTDGDDAIARRQFLTALGASPTLEAPTTPTPANWPLAQP